MNAYWDSGEVSAGFDMFSTQRQAEWAVWANSTATPDMKNSPPSGYHFLFDKDKISNLDRSILPDIAKNLSEVKIRNVVLVLMESTPSHSFPVTSQSPFYQRLLKSRKSKWVYDDIENITPNAAQLFLGGPRIGANDTQRHGIIIKGAEASSSYTLKSQTASHCGLYPLPMDFSREAVPDAHHYQPCLPHILHALNGLQGDKGYLDSTSNQTWNLLYAQACDEVSTEVLDV